MKNRWLAALTLTLTLFGVSLTATPAQAHTTSTCPQFTYVCLNAGTNHTSGARVYHVSNIANSPAGCTSLSSFGDTHSSAANHSDWYVNLWENSNCTGKRLKMAKQSHYPNLGFYGLDKKVSAISKCQLAPLGSC